MDDWDDDLPSANTLLELEKQALVKHCSAQVRPPSGVSSRALKLAESTTSLSETLYVMKNERRDL